MKINEICELVAAYFEIVFDGVTFYWIEEQKEIGLSHQFLLIFFFVLLNSLEIKRK